MALETPFSLSFMSFHKMLVCGYTEVTGQLTGTDALD